MPSAECHIREFLSGNPPKATRPSPDEDLAKDKSDERQEGEIDKPPKSKLSMREQKALDVQSLQVSNCPQGLYISNVCVLMTGYLSVAQKHRKQFSDAWLTFLRLPVSYPAILVSTHTHAHAHTYTQLASSQCKHVLVSMHSRVIPHLIDPRLLLDFFTQAYDKGGVVGLLALNGLFVLMNQHHL